MKALKYLSCILLLLTNYSLFAQDQSILIFDPNDVSASFQSTFSQLTDDFIFVADTLDDTIFNYDAAFLFIDFPYELSETDVSTLVNYSSDGKPLYLFSNPFIDSTTSPFWNHIGLEEMYYLLVSSLVDSVTGVDTTFTNGVVIDTTFMSWSVPASMGTISPILIGQSTGLDVQAVYVSTIDTLNVILDLYNLIYNYDFLQKVLERFGLIPPGAVDEEFNSVAGFELFQNYPNPFNPNTYIEFRIADFGLVTLKVYDVLGNEIATLVNEENQTGTYEVEFNATSHSGNVRNLTSGIYFYQLKAGDFIETKKMILLK